VITVNDKTIAIWHLAVEDDFDYLAALYRNGTDQLMFKYRFIHADDPDTAHWYTVGPTKGPEQDFENTMMLTIRLMEKTLGWRADEIRMKDGDVEAFCDELLSRPYIRARAADCNAN
jgi:hypothetical protein